jgi:hypothetical protein
MDKVQKKNILSVNQQLVYLETQYPDFTNKFFNFKTLQVSRVNKIVFSHNESQQDALFLKFIWYSILHISDRYTVHHQEYHNTVYRQ